MAHLYLIRHPKTHIDPSRKPHEWGLSEQGQSQVQSLLEAPFWRSVTTLYTSPQTKALEPAKVIGTHYEIPVITLPGFAEVERGIDTFVTTTKFNGLLQNFFNFPDRSIEGWERASDARSRFQSNIDKILTAHKDESIAVISHGTILALYTAYLYGEPPALIHWDRIRFAMVATIDLNTMKFLHPFVEAPYKDVPPTTPKSV